MRLRAAEARAQRASLGLDPRTGCPTSSSDDEDELLRRRRQHAVYGQSSAVVALATGLATPAPGSELRTQSRRPGQVGYGTWRVDEPEAHAAVVGRGCFSREAEAMVRNGWVMVEPGAPAWQPHPDTGGHAAVLVARSASRGGEAASDSGRSATSATTTTADH